MNVILTGIPRSGTTLACYLLNQLADVVALVEPIDVMSLGHDPVGARERVESFFDGARRSLLRRRAARSKHVEGRVPDDTAQAVPGAQGLRTDRTSAGEVLFDKPLSEAFVLVVKHPGAFTALLPVLAPRFPCYAVVRNPLATLVSWASVDFPIREGRVPVAELLDPALARGLSDARDVVDRQLRLLSWFFEAYRGLPADRVLRYEEIVRSSGRALSVITERAGSLQQALSERHRPGDVSTLRTLAERLLETDGAYWAFYSRSSVEDLLDRRPRAWQR